MNTMNKIEVWKDISGYDGVYQVSSFGRVKSFKCNRERILKTNTNTIYFRIGLRKNNVTISKNIHQLVAIEFLNHKPDGHKTIVDHIDNNPLNNRIDNLQLISHRNNLSKDKKGYTSKYVGVSWDKQKNKWKAQIQLNKKTIPLGRYKNEIDASNAYQKELSRVK